MMIRWESDTRYYMLHVQPDLFGTLTLRRVWGGLGTSRGGEKIEPILGCDESERQNNLIQRIREISRTRARNGYTQLL